ncbi:MAG TPA: tetratricopeptide repeat protein, partial [Pyrinomonadaceae bacterium]|nr:tetratricopeptide repeat protein [Pyrinomonadaceae bacterium]
MSRNFQHFRHGAVLIMFLFLAAGSAAAQGGSIQGRVALPSGGVLNEATRISLQNSRGVKATVFTDNQGQFSFRSLTPGTYDVVVEADPSRFDVTTVSVEVFPNSPAIIRIVLKEKKWSASKNTANSVSATELDAAVPAKARKEFERASDAGNEGKTEEAISHLRKAIELYPGYLMARNDLGAQLLAQGKLAEAAEELGRAIKIDSKAFNPKLNLGIVLVQQHKFAEAAAVLRDAIALNSAAPSARLYNGLALEGLNDLEAAEKELKASHDL